MSKRDPAFEGKLERALVICPDKRTTTALGKQFATRFLNQLTNSLALNNIPSTSVDLDKDALDNGSLIEKAAKRFHAGQLLGWTLAGMNTMSAVSQTLPGDIPNYRSSTTVVFEFHMTDVWVNHAVWRARFSFQSPPTPEAVANQLIEELVAAKLLIQQSPQQNR